ncbi:hypothetical protein GpartN1_g4523.t1 [Galdieria partita]|uniref:Methyltransferase type 11 domain-containing protein n=1 Tax=Galdieria partita TaxID=83374 RepID=A0A9C7Q074_9RHOD|nr:hypothetical protein GpartN1_g4523.t1 [Galdieria partita]
MSNNNDDWQPTLYRHEHAFVFEKGISLVKLLNPQPFELVLDLGCGTGELTEQVSRSGCFVIGVDASSAMTYSAKNSFPEVDFIVADGTQLCFRSVFDSVYSNAVIHWIRKPLQLLQNIHDCLLPGKPLVAEFGGEGNVESITTALSLATEQHTNKKWVPTKWYFPKPAQFECLLQEAGFTVTLNTCFDRPTKLQEGSQGLRSWLRMFCPELSRNYSKEEYQKILSTVEKELRSKLFDGTNWYADYKRIRLVAVRNR